MNRPCGKYIFVGSRRRHFLIARNNSIFSFPGKELKHTVPPFFHGTGIAALFP
jgi:hypothetical protein